MFVADLLAGKTILVTGGGTGLGRSFALRLAELGPGVVICGRRAEVLEATAAEIRAVAKARVAAHVCDVRDAAAVEAMFEAIWREGPLDALINNAAGNFIARTETLSPRAVDAILDVVLHGAFYCSIAAGRRWIAERRPGTLLSIVSTAANSGRAFTAPSAAAKAGVVALMKSLAVEWGPHGIRALSVAPGLFPTKGAWDRLYPPGSSTKPEAADVPLRRTGEHAEIANLIAYLLSDYAGYLNGDCITIDGGRDLLNGGGAGVAGLFDWTPEQWDAFRRQGKS
jgi:NAD(P)-dependent dehydrogenase (short-subunit alcohol dehydrogenase family)